MSKRPISWRSPVSHDYTLTSIPLTRLTRRRGCQVFLSVACIALLIVLVDAYVRLKSVRTQLRGLRGNVELVVTDGDNANLDKLMIEQNASALIKIQAMSNSEMLAARDFSVVTRSRPAKYELGEMHVAASDVLKLLNINCRRRAAISRVLIAIDADADAGEQFNKLLYVHLRPQAKMGVVRFSLHPRDNESWNEYLQTQDDDPQITLRWAVFFE